MEYPNEPDVHTGDGVDDSELHGGGNGFTKRVPAWGEVEFVPTKPQRISLWRRVMASKTVRNIADYTQAERRPVPAWVPGAILTVAVMLLTNLGLHLYWKGRLDEKVERLEAATAKVQQLVEENRELKGRVESLHSLEEWVGLLVVYEQGLREDLGPLTSRYGVKLPPMPPRPSHDNN